MDFILSRRSIRKYTGEPVTDEEILSVLKAAMSAPSAGNQQPWHFIVIRDREILDRIPEFHQYAQMMRDAPAAIMVCGDESLEKFKGFWEQDCSAATQNALIAAHSLGLGAVWVGIHPVEFRVEQCRKLLDIPEGVIPFSVIPLGHPDEEKPPSERFEPSRIHYNRW